MRGAHACRWRVRLQVADLPPPPARVGVILAEQVDAVLAKRRSCGFGCGTCLTGGWGFAECPVCLGE
jgi:hypothetical protein